jgi:hypothetical protein
VTTEPLQHDEHFYEPEEIAGLIERAVALGFSMDEVNSFTVRQLEFIVKRIQ